MKKILLIFLCAGMLLSANMTHAQQDSDSQEKPGSAAVEEVQKADPAAAQAIANAIQRGDLQEAKSLYQNFKKSRPGQPVKSTIPQAAAAEPPRPSLFEQTLPGNLTQFGYALFNKTVSTFTISTTMPVGPDYIIGPGDHFTLTLWGTTEGIYNLQVTKEGTVTLPKVGVVPVAGVRFGELEKTLKRHLSRYYNNFNLSIAMGGIKTLTIYVAGEVVTPGSYSLSSLTSVYGALFSAGGPTKMGSLRAIQVLRSGKVIKTLDLYDFLLKGDRSQDIKLQNEDTVFVPLIGPVAGVAGTVYRPAIYELKGPETLSDLIETAGGLLPIALGGRLQLTRYVDNQRKVFLDIKLDNLQSGATGTYDAFKEKVRNMDAISIRPLYDKVWETVDLGGAVSNPGSFQWRPDLRLREIIVQGQPLPQSDMKRAEVVRLTKDMMERTIIPVDLAALMAGDASQNIALEPQDQVRVYSTLKEAEKATVGGEVVTPGEYEINKGEHLSDLLRRVGGFTAQAYPYGAVFKRKGVKNAEARNMNALIIKTQSEIIQNAASRTSAAITAEEAQFAKAEQNMSQSLLENLKAMQQLAEGRVAISITANIDEWAGSNQDLLLQDGDSLLIPKQPQEVLVLGEVFTPGAQIFLPEMSVKDYLDRTGGMTRNADHSQIFVVQADGFSYGPDSPSVGNIEKAKLRAGDAVFVPQKVEREAVLRTTKDIIDILFKTAVVFATIHLLF